MDDDAFARQVSAWLDPFAVIQAARMHAGSTAVAEAPATWTWATPQYASARDVGVDELMTKFLRGFRLQPQYVKLIRHSWEEPIPSEAWDRLSNQSFSGEVSFSEFPADAPEGTVVWLAGRAATMLVLKSPLEFLGECVGSYANTWLEMAAHQATGVGPEVWLEHSSPAELFVYIESVVARACGIEPTVAVLGRGQNLRYAAVSVVGGDPDVIRELARTHAPRLGYFSPGFL